MAPEEMSIAKIQKHFFEEPPISGERGSGTVFFRCCNLKCVYCQNKDISRIHIGKTMTPLQLAEKIKMLESDGVHNINFVTPTHYSHKIIETLKIYRPSVPIVYNTSGFESEEIIYGLCEFVDVFLPDFKYGDDGVAFKLSGIKNYLQTAVNAVKVMIENKKLVLLDGLIKQGTVIRHLVLPGYLENSQKVLKSLDSVLNSFEKQNIIFSLMSQFTPNGGAENNNIDRKLKPLEYKVLISQAEKIEFYDIYLQNLDSAKSCFTPTFDQGGY